MVKRQESGRTKGGDRTVDLSGLLRALPAQKLERKDLSGQLEEIALENKLLSLANVSVERETEVLREAIAAAKK